jgi:PPOX class probable F420-dependent enzyme
MSALPEDVRALAAGPNIAHLATVLPDGGPHSVPLWIGVEGDRLAFLTGPGSRKARNLSRDPRVSISITENGNPGVMAHVRGHVAERVEGDRGWEIIDRISTKYTGGPYPLRSDRVAFLVDVDHAWGHAFG